MDLTLISQWLGHANLDTSLIYAHADTEQKRQAIEKSMGGRVTGGIEVPKYIVDDETLLKRLYGLRGKKLSRNFASIFPNGQAENAV